LTWNQGEEDLVILNKYVIHCLGPAYGIDKSEDQLLADCYRNALRLAEENKEEH